MTPEQYERWKDAARRMARTCFKGYRRPGPRHVLACVEEFFAGIDYGGGCYDAASVLAIRDWDNSGEYPEGHPGRRQETRETYCPCKGKDGKPRRKNKPLRWCKECHGSGRRYAWNRVPCLDDAIAEYEEQWMPNYWHNQDEARWEARRDRWCGPARCCLRAGLGLAVPDGSGMGVLGFTAGDLRRMYPEGVPEWIARQWDEGRRIGSKGEVPGVGFIPEDKGPSEPFEEMKDKTPLWL